MRDKFLRIVEQINELADEIEPEFYSIAHSLRHDARSISSSLRICEAQRKGIELYGKGNFDWFPNAPEGQEIQPKRDPSTCSEGGKCSICSLLCYWGGPSIVD